MNANQLAIIVAYYLSKFDKLGLQKLGFKTYSEAFETTARVLGVKKNYVKFRRDEFDPVHPWRKGWIREMDKRIIKSIEVLQNIDEPDLREIVLGILNDPTFRESEEVIEISSLLIADKDDKVEPGTFVLRGPTGKAAEEFFIQYYRQNKYPFEGQLIDCREIGVGYDFEIKSEKESVFIEVKGLSASTGGVLFTNKEWLTAIDMGPKYFLCLISNLDEDTQINFINNPSKHLAPKRNIRPTIQINWSITQKQLNGINDKETKY